MFIPKKYLLDFRATNMIKHSFIDLKRNIYKVNIRIYLSICIFIDAYIHSYKYSLEFKATYIFGYSFVQGKKKHLSHTGMDTANLLVYQARESILVPAGIMVAQFLKKMYFVKPF